jgi:hypothetical protein
MRKEKFVSGIRVCDCDRRYKPQFRQTVDGQYSVCCPNCGTKGASVPYTKPAETRQKAVDLWNSRKMEAA